MLENIDDHIINKRNVLLRPGASRRISFRGTPGGKCSIRITSRRGPNTGDTEPVGDLPDALDPGLNVVLPDLLANSSRKVNGFGRNSNSGHRGSTKFKEKLIDAQLQFGATDLNPNEIGVSLLDNNPNRVPIISFDDAGGLLVLPEPDPNPPAILQPPMRIRGKVRDGVTFHDEVTVPNPSGHPASLHVNPNHSFINHEIIDIVYTNPNDFNVLFNTFINVQNELTITSTILPYPMIGRLFEDALLFIAPSFGIRNGKLFFSFADEISSEFGISNDPIDIGIDDLDVSVEIKPVGFELLSNEDAIRRMAEEVEAEMRRVAAAFPNLSETVENIQANFVNQTVETFFSQGTLQDLYINMDISPSLWAGPLGTRSLLSGSESLGNIPPYLKGKRNDVAIKFEMRLENITTEIDQLKVNVDTITADLYIIFRSASTLVPHPSVELRDDSIRVGKIYPRFQLKVDISRINTTLDFGDNPIANVGEFLVEKGLDAIASFLRDDFEGLASKEGMKFLNAHIDNIGELITEMMPTIANRDHLFRKLSTNSQGWKIDTFDQIQLAVPFVQADPIDHRFDNIDVNTNPVSPIDGPMPQDALQKLKGADHLVFLMMENRSFDHMLGYLSHPNHGTYHLQGDIETSIVRTDVDGLDGQARTARGLFEGTVYTPQSEARVGFRPNPGHDFDTVARQINDGAMDGFESEFDRRINSDDEINPNGNLNDPFRIHKFYTGKQLKTYNKLSDDALILDRWFCSIPGGTYPNRSCYYSGITQFLNNSEIFEDAGYLKDLTVFDVMDFENVDWRIYESSVSFLRMYDKYRLEKNKIRPIEELFGENAPVLPKVTFIDPDFKGSTGCPNDDHAPTNISNGQKFISDVINSLKKTANWSKTVLVILYDEHGGFADHVPPPGTSRSNFPPDINGDAQVPLAHPDAASFGVRIPAIIVSPLVEKGTVGHQIYDHATVYKTILERFMPRIRRSSIVPDRVHRARHIGELLKLRPPVLANPDTAVAPPAPPGIGVIIQPIAPDLVLADIIKPQTRFPKPCPKPNSVYNSDSDAVRPQYAVDDYKEFHEFLTRLGNPISKA
ncbi:MAG: alkaline phosphatase family protein [Cellulophaga sp.]